MRGIQKIEIPGDGPLVPEERETWDDLKLGWVIKHCHHKSWF